MDPLYLNKLLTRIAQKDEEAFNLFFDHYYVKLVHIAMSFTSDKTSAQEVVSDLLFKILKNPKTLLNISDFQSYIYLAVKNQSYTFLRKNQHRIAFESIYLKEVPIPVSKNPESQLISDELYRLVEKTVQAFPPKRKATFLLVREEGKKYREVAEILDVSVKTVELHMSLALKELREVVREYTKSGQLKISS